MHREYPLWSHHALCPSARYVGGVSGRLCECSEPRNCKGAIAAMLEVTKHIQSWLTTDGVSDAAEDVILTITNDGKIYADVFVPMCKLLGERYSKGQLNRDNALASWREIAVSLGHSKLADGVAIGLLWKYAELIASYSYFGKM